MTALRFNQIFWGLILVILDLEINGFDVLPDVVGYILVAIGSGGLKDISPKFRLAGALSWSLLFLSLLGFVVASNFATALHFVHLAVNCTMMWNLLGGVMAFCDAHGRQDLTELASRRRVMYVILIVSVRLVAYGVGNSGGTALAVILVISLLVLVFMIIHLIRRVRNEIAMGMA